VCFNWKNEAVMEGDGLFDDAVEVH
jgi:hypothetical protein